MAVRWYLAYALSYRNIEELIKDWKIGLDHFSVQRWVAEYGSWLQVKVRKYLTLSGLSFDGLVHLLVELHKDLLGFAL